MQGLRVCLNILEMALYKFLSLNILKMAFINLLI